MGLNPIGASEFFLGFFATIHNVHVYKYNLLYIFLFIYLHNFYHDNEKAEEKIDTIRDSTTERGSKLQCKAVHGPNKFTCLR